MTLIVLHSCEDDDFSRAYIDTEVKNELVGALELSRQVAAPSTMIGFSFTLPQSFSTEATVEVSATTFDFMQTKAFVTVPAGATSGTGLIEMPGETGDLSGFNGISDYAKVELTGVALTQPEEGSVDDPYTLSSESISVRAIDYNDTYMSPRSDAMKILFDWENPGANDLDMYVYATDFSGPYEVAESGSRYEGDWFNDFHPDGDYFVAIGFYVASGNIPYTFQFTHPDGSVDYYEGMFADSETLSFEYPIININKTTVDGVVTYTTSLP